jgi:hypothetical protein
LNAAFLQKLLIKAFGAFCLFQPAGKSQLSTAQHLGLRVSGASDCTITQILIPIFTPWLTVTVILLLQGSTCEHRAENWHWQQSDVYGKTMPTCKRQLWKELALIKKKTD